MGSPNGSTPDARLPGPNGQLGVVALGAVTLESGVVLPEVRLAVQRWGAVSPARDNVVLVEHALTGDSHVTGPAGPGHPSPGWWEGMVGPGAPLDTGRWCVLAANVLGGCRGSTGPSSLAPDGKPWGARFPIVTIRDQVTAEQRLAELLGIERFAAVVGGSMGGMRVLEWIIDAPHRVSAALVLAVGARATADQIGTQSTQIAAITADPDWQGGDYHGTGRIPLSGMGIARRIAHLSYRAEAELDHRFGNAVHGDDRPAARGRYAVDSYLAHQAAKLNARFDPGSYVALTEAMNRHDVGRGRGGIPAALASCPVPVLVAGIDSDRLYPVRTQAELAAALPQCAGFEVIGSHDGHDGFLTEIDRVGALVRTVLSLSAATA
ncbi:homoserine O-acetyltransferase [Nocardia sp. BMG111209]|uniref:homoserine O-acetyltransferase MetX n=1 Tax=Nocardia sp. BMG111209 TaxID=1160137 RepID=UPI00036F52EF|nr:homoserine O-acetyltransferase [Nocardia sp. BMG111209]